MTQIFDPTMNFLQRSLDTSLHRQVVLSSNIVNLDTPGFTPHDVDFDKALDTAGANLRVAMAKTDPAHLGVDGTKVGKIPTYERPDTEPGLDGNSVDLDVQMARLAQNGILYSANTQVISKKLALLKYAVTEGAG